MAIGKYNCKHCGPRIIGHKDGCPELDNQLPDESRMNDGQAGDEMERIKRLMREAVRDFTEISAVLCGIPRCDRMGSQEIEAPVEEVMKDPTAVKRNASYRQRKQEAGLVLLQVWVRPEDREKVRKYAEKLRKL